ncbi:MAG: hypothetical protein LBC39_00325 [Methanobrevibacter sp.]|jgi:hypothetical protein|nr:hypothetical protein [Candidatus Methanovirga aequatorialis]
MKKDMMVYILNILYGGRPSKLSPEDKEKFNKILEKENYIDNKKKYLKY